MDNISEISQDLYPNDNINQKFDPSFQVVWKGITYKINQRFRKSRLVLDNISGFYKSGQILAILGPSGAGKSSLLGCLTGTKRKGLVGSVTISVKRKMKQSFIPQNDYLQNELTVYEILFYASKLKNKSGIDHKSNVERVVKLLKIENCINERPKQCSGGQKKRISIAMELISRPDILILDEPTSGLDASTTFQLISNLSELCQLSPPMAIIATIHQPSLKLFNLFDSVYIMKFGGQCIYQGLPQGLVDYLTQYGFRCPQFHNPADFVLEVASNQYGVVTEVVSVKRVSDEELTPFENNIEVYFQHRVINEIMILFERIMKIELRGLMRVPFRTGIYLIFGLQLIFFFGTDIGDMSGCPKDFVHKSGSYIENHQRVVEQLFHNMSCVFIASFNVLVGSLYSNLLTIPKDMNIILKEYRNGSFSIFSYYISIVLVGLLLDLIVPNVLTIPVFFGTGQYWEQVWRLNYFIVIYVLLAITGSNLGLAISAFFMSSPSSALFAGFFIFFPYYLFSGYFKPVYRMPSLFRWVSSINFVKYGLDSTLITLYGYDRCDQKPVEQNSNKTVDFMSKIESSDELNGSLVLSMIRYFSGQQIYSEDKPYVLKSMDLNDNDLNYGLIFMIVNCISFTLLIYLALLRSFRNAS